MPASSSAQAHYFPQLADPTITGVMAVGHLSNVDEPGVRGPREPYSHSTQHQPFLQQLKRQCDILSRQKDFDMVIDLHRDAGVPHPTVVIDGRKSPDWCWLGDSGKHSLSHPDFQKNLDLA